MTNYSKCDASLEIFKDALKEEGKLDGLISRIDSCVENGNDITISEYLKAIGNSVENNRLLCDAYKEKKLQGHTEFGDSDCEDIVFVDNSNETFTHCEYDEEESRLFGLECEEYHRRSKECLDNLEKLYPHEIKQITSDKSDIVSVDSQYIDKLIDNRNEHKILEQEKFRNIYNEIFSNFASAYNIPVSRLNNEEESSPEFELFIDRISQPLKRNNRRMERIINKYSNKPSITGWKLKEQ